MLENQYAAELGRVCLKIDTPLNFVNLVNLGNAKLFLLTQRRGPSREYVYEVALARTKLALLFTLENNLVPGFNAWAPKMLVWHCTLHAHQCQVPTPPPRRWVLVNAGFPVANGAMAILNTLPLSCSFITTLSLNYDWWFRKKMSTIQGWWRGLKTHVSRGREQGGIVA